MVGHHGEAVEIHLSGLRLVVHPAEVSTEAFLGSVDESLSQFMQLSAVVAHYGSHHVAVVVDGNEGVQIAVLGVFPFHERCHHGAEVGKRMVFAGEILATVVCHCRHNEL